MINKIVVMHRMKAKKNAPSTPNRIANDFTRIFALFWFMVILQRLKFATRLILGWNLFSMIVNYLVFIETYSRKIKPVRMMDNAKLLDCVSVQAQGVLFEKTSMAQRKRLIFYRHTT